MSGFKDGHIDWREATGLMTAVLAGKVFLTIPQDLADKGKTAGWAIILIGMVLGLLGFALTVRLLELFPGQTLVEVTEEVCGPWLGVTVSLGYLAFFIVFDVLILRSFAETMLTTVLPRTPISVVMGLLVTAIVYCVYQGLEAFARGAWLVLPFITAGYLGIVAGVLPHFELNNLFPVLGAGPGELVKWGALKVSFFGEVILLAVIAPALRDLTGLKKTGYTAIVVSGLVLIITTVVFTGVFGIPGAAMGGTNPMFQMARLIFLGRFVQRIESLFLFVWVFVALIKLSAGLYAGAVTLAGILRLPVYRPLIFPLALLIYTAAFIPRSWAAVNQIENSVLRSYGWTASFLLPAVVLVVALVRRKSGLGTGGGQTDEQ